MWAFGSAAGKVWLTVFGDDPQGYLDDMSSDLQTRLEQLRLERRAARQRALAYAVAIAPVLAANLLGLLTWQAAIVADAAAIAAAAWWYGIERRAAHRRRVMLDDLIVHGWVNVAPDDVRERDVRAALAAAPPPARPRPREQSSR